MNSNIDHTNFNEVKEYLLLHAKTISDTLNLKEAEFRENLEYSFVALQGAMKDKPIENFDEDKSRFLVSIISLINDYLLENPTDIHLNEAFLCYCEMISNLISAYELKYNSRELSLFKLLTSLKRTLHDELLILSLVLKSLSYKIGINTSYETLSNKYLTELKSYVSSLDHDEPYGED